MEELQENKENVQFNIDSMQQDILASKERQQQISQQAEQVREHEAHLEEENAPSVDNTNDVLNLYKTLSNIHWDFEQCTDDLLIGGFYCIVFYFIFS